MEQKKCVKCDLDLNLCEFTTSKNTKDGLKNMCKECVRIKNKEWRLNNPNYRKEYRKNNIELLNVKDKKYYEDNKEIILEKKKTYNAKSRDLINKQQRKYRNEVLKKNPLFIVSSAIRDSIRARLKSKKLIKITKTETILGCSFSDFKLHIESKFKDWMSWDNYGNPKDGVYELNKTWDIDHIIPMCTAITEDDVYRLNHYTNLQPLCSYVNRFIKKGNT